MRLTDLPGPRRLAATAVPVLLLGVLAACGDTGGDGEAASGSEMGTIRTEPPAPTESELPPVQPATAADCPYLAADELAGLGEGPVTDVRIDESVDPPACFFYDSDGAIGLTTTIYTVASPERAAQLVTESAPADLAEPATADGGWTGGSTDAPGGSLLVLSNGDRVLAVQSTHDDAGTVRQVAELVGPRLGD